ncbi:MAG TPA: mechanosensitive ion channel family protein [Casimicrobiaceae bacterium]
MELTRLLANVDNAWLAVGIAVLAAIAFGLLVHVVSFGVLRRVGRFSALVPVLAKELDRPARAVLPLLALQFVWTAIPDSMALPPAIAIATALLLIAALTWLVMRAVSGIGEAIIRLHPSNVSDNLEARRVATQTRVLSRTVMTFVAFIGAAVELMMFPSLRMMGTSLLASAGVAGLVAGIAARPVLGNLIAGLQIALTQPIRIDDVVVIEDEWGRIEDITSAYVVVKVWDERRLVVPLQWIVEHPFQNWTRTSAKLMGTVFLWTDYRMPLAPLREELQRVCAAAPEWDGRVALLQVVDANERAVQLRVLVSSADASKNWDLRCRVREALLDFMQREYADALPRVRAVLGSADRENAPQAQGAPSSPPEQAGRGASSSIQDPVHAGEHAPEQARKGTADREPLRAPAKIS